ncbi:Isotrichodermin C-15 hydroxylase, partial [Colletotrichum tanaceti]
VLLTLLVLVVRRRVLHPLRSFPGPWLNSVSEIPAAYALATGAQHSYYRDLHAKYGSVVRVAPGELSCIDADAWEEIYGIRKGGANMDKSPIFIGAVSPMDGQTGISLAPDEVHSRQRRALAYPFSNGALLQQQEILQRHVDKLMAALRKMAADRRPVDVSHSYTYTTFDVMGDLCFAEPFGCLDQGSATEWSTSVSNVFMSAAWDQAIRRVAGVGTPLTRLLVRLLIPAKAAGWRKTHFSNSREKTLRRLADPDRDHRDLVYHILRKNESKRSLSETEIILNMVLLISAGTETTATLLTGWTYYVCSHPEVYGTLAAEVRGRFASSADIRWETVKELPYLNATIHEALRLFPPAAGNLQRVVPAGGATLDGRFVPAGTTVAVAPWAASHSALNYAEPDAFRPERWLGDPRFAGDKLHASQPFSLGPRGCIGKNLSYFEMRLIMSHLLWNFDLELDGGVSGESARLWDMDGEGKKMKVYQTLFKPSLFVNLKEDTSGLSTEGLRQLQARLLSDHNNSPEVLVTTLDVRNAEDVEAWVRQTVRRFGRLDGAANLAGVFPKSLGLAGVSEQDPDEWDRVLGVNLTGLMHCMRAQLRVLSDNNSVVTASSIAGSTGRRNNASYTASKHGVLGLTRTAAKEVGARGIRVNAVCPGRIVTPMLHSAEDGLGTRVRPGDPTYPDIALRRDGQPREVARLVAFLLSDESSYISGADISIDGGWRC